MILSSHVSRTYDALEQDSDLVPRMTRSQNSGAGFWKRVSKKLSWIPARFEQPTHMKLHFAAPGPHRLRVEPEDSPSFSRAASCPGGY